VKDAMTAKDDCVNTATCRRNQSREEAMSLIRALTIASILSGLLASAAFAQQAEPVANTGG
jgi:hypothetical protein